MATRIKARADDLYEQDLYAWARAQADLLRAGRFAATLGSAEDGAQA